MKQVKNILALSQGQAMDFFMKSEQYHGFELPEYFVFDGILDYVRNSVGNKSYEECIAENVSAENLSDVNLNILLNKDGKYAVRPIVLANPYLYYFLVRELCSEKGWAIVQDIFSKYKVPHLTSCALPVIPVKEENFHKSTAILNWWNSMEQRAIELSLEYRYMFMTDITNCYGSINPQSFDWAFGLKGTEFETSDNELVAKNVQRYLRAFQHGRNIGIPQGSAIFDFVGEIILGYSDLLLHEAIVREHIDVPYEIIRYRDDYRIFCNDKGVLEKISYILQHVLENLNFRINSQKTKLSDEVILDAVKKDKRDYIYNTPIYNKAGSDFDGIQKNLMYILMFGKEHPNSGQLKNLLSNVDDRVKEKLQKKHLEPMDKDEERYQETKNTSDVFSQWRIQIYKEVSGLRENVRAMSAICTQIAMENVTASHYAMRVISRMVASLEDEDEKREIINNVYVRLCNQPNSTYTQLWLQNITLKQDVESGCSPYDMRLCRLVAGEDKVEIWNNDWLKTEFTDGLPVASVVNQETIRKINGVITFRESRAYEEYGA